MANKAVNKSPEKENYHIRRANVSDVKKMQTLINYYASKGEMLPKSLSDLYESVRNFWVIEIKKKVIGTCALQVSWEDLAEVKSLAVTPGCRGKGFGKILVNKCIEDAKEIGVKTIFTLTYKPDFFKHFGFKKVPRSRLPHKVWNECIRCVKFPNCDENALLLRI